MAEGTKTKGAELDPKLLLKLIDQVESNARQSQDNTKALVEQMAVNFAKSLESQAQLLSQLKRDSMQDIDTHQLKSKVEVLEDRMSSAPPAAMGGRVKPPSYKRILRRGETIDDIAVRGHLHPIAKEAGARFATQYGEVLAKELGDPQKKLDSIEGGGAAFRAVTAAYIDRTGLDETTRYLLTRRNVLLGEFLRVHRDSSPSLHESLAVVEAINRRLVGLLHYPKSWAGGAAGEGVCGFYDHLVKAHGKKRGWSREHSKTVARLLTDRYASAGKGGTDHGN